MFHSWVYVHFDNGGEEDSAAASFFVESTTGERRALDDERYVAVGQVRGQEVLRMAVADVQEFPDGAHEISLDCGGVRRRKVLEASEDVGGGVGGHAGEIAAL